MLPTNLVYFAHGKESGPWGTKITHMAEIARAKGFQVQSPDYSETMNPDHRVQMLLGLQPRAQNLVLVGSSMGAYVSAVASKKLKPVGLFLLAPAFYVSGFEHKSPQPYARHTLIIHGWEDEIIPVKNSIAYAQRFETDLYLVKSNHRLMSALPEIEELFKVFLDRILLEQ